MAQTEAYLLTFLTVLVGHVKSDICFSNGYKDSTYCSYDCCGSGGYQYCCTYYVYGGGTIAGIVVGCLVGLGLLIGSIVCCCCYQRRRAASGQVIQAHTNPGLSVMTATTTINGTQMQTNQLPPGMYPPSYQPSPQMTYGYTPYMPGNSAMNNPHGVPPPAYDNVFKK